MYSPKYGKDSPQSHFNRIDQHQIRRIDCSVDAPWAQYKESGSFLKGGDGRYWIRTSDPFRVKEVRYRCANRP